MDGAIDSGNVAIRHLLKALSSEPENEKDSRLFWLVASYLSGTFPSNNININTLNVSQEMLNTVDCNASEDVNLCLSLKETNQKNINKHKKRLQNKG